MRVKLTETEFDEIIESLHWSRRHGGTGFGGFYEDLLDFHLSRRTLPSSRVPEQPEEDDKPRGRRDRDQGRKIPQPTRGQRELDVDQST